MTNNVNGGAISLLGNLNISQKKFSLNQNIQNKLEQALAEMKVDEDIQKFLKYLEDEMIDYRIKFGHFTYYF